MRHKNAKLIRSLLISTRLREKFLFFSQEDNFFCQENYFWDIVRVGKIPQPTFGEVFIKYAIICTITNSGVIPSLVPRVGRAGLCGASTWGSRRPFGAPPLHGNMCADLGSIPWWYDKYQLQLWVQPGIKQTYKHTWKQTYKQTYNQTYKQTCKQTNKQTNTQTNIQTNIQTYKHTSIQTNIQTNKHTYKHTNEQTHE